MSFNYNNAESAQVAILDPAGSLTSNLTMVRAPVDVSAMESEAAIANTVASSTSAHVTIGLQDAGSTGAGTTAIDATVGGSGIAWTANTVKAQTMSTSASDLDADDAVNVAYTEGAALDPDSIWADVSFVYGIPGGIA
jgi:hypothetical protein|tara:strand:+ start:65 stop:478 length:414 start_codon:yes stop_codon:yes gene_type:complete